jgi:hypothetical protein
MLVSVERGSESFMLVQNLFLSGIGSFVTTNNIINIHRYSPKHIISLHSVDMRHLKNRSGWQAWGVVLQVQDMDGLDLKRKTCSGFKWMVLWALKQLRMLIWILAFIFLLKAMPLPGSYCTLTHIQI